MRSTSNASAWTHAAPEMGLSTNLPLSIAIDKVDASRLNQNADPHSRQLRSQAILT
jgi:hypothetical protein